MSTAPNSLPTPPEDVSLDGVTRRSTLKWMALAWTGFAATVRFLFPNVLFEPPTRFKAGDPSTYSLGVDERWKEKYGVWIVRDTNSIYALVAVCVHLGCTPNWLAAQNKFKCPCHGSGYYVSGINFEGPSRSRPRPEVRLGSRWRDIQQAIVSSQFWKSIFRVGIPNTNRKRVLAMLGNVVLHLHPV